MKFLEKLGFGFTEHMGGTYTSASGKLPGGKFDFNFEVDSDDVTDAVRQIVGKAVGTVTMEGLAQNAPAEGTLELSPIWKRRIRYTFSFTGNDGRRYKFDGYKSINPLRMVKSWTTLPGKVYDEGSGEVVADVMTYFDLRADIAKLLRSFRTQPLTA